MEKMSGNPITIKYTNDDGVPCEITATPRAFYKMWWYDEIDLPCNDAELDSIEQDGHTISGNGILFEHFIQDVCRYVATIL